MQVEWVAYAPWAANARAHKERWLEITKSYDTPPMLVPEWDGEIIALIGARTDADVEGDHPIHSIARALNLVVQLLDPTVVTVLQDTYQQWRNHDDDRQISLADLAAEGGIERGEVIEAMVAFRCDRKGAVSMVSMPYSRLPLNQVEWHDRESQATTGGNLQGRVPDMMRFMMKQPTRANEEIDRLASEMGVSRERSKIVRTAVALRVFEGSGGMVIPIHEELQELRPEAFPEINLDTIAGNLLAMKRK